MKKTKCPYCGDAPMSHSFSYMGGVISMFLDPLFSGTSRMIPESAVRFAEFLLKVLFYILLFLGIIRLSRDPEKAVTLRSRVIWDEAKKRGINMEQVVVFGKPTDNYRAEVKGKWIYFDSLPLPSAPFGSSDNWDDKSFLKKRLAKAEIPVPACAGIPNSRAKRESLFERFTKPVIVKPRVGSRGRHTTTNIGTLEEFERALGLAKKICPHAIMEEHLEGYVCRATCVNGKLAGFYRAESASITGDGKKTVRELIDEKDAARESRVEKVKVSRELEDYLSRAGFGMHDIPPEGMKLALTHRTGRLFGGSTREMLDELHSSFKPIIEKAASVTGLPVAGFDCIIPDPEKAASAQRWGIIECNTLPFIDLHYYALSGKPKNIAGMIWDLWYNS